jgi:phage gpG-like protein
MLTFQILGEREVLADIKRMSHAMMMSAGKAIKEETLAVQKLAKLKASGEVLRNRTGTLRRKINARFIETPTSIFGLVGIKLSYAAVHELGFHGTVSVREHLRRTKLGGAATVRAHSRIMNMPERSFLRASLRERRPQIRAALLDAIRKAARK